MRAYERFLNYVPVWTTSDETSDTVPSADRELVLARMLVEEMKGLEIADARVDDKGYVYGHIPATPGCEDKPSLGLVAHMDTVADASGENIKPQIIENYDGKDVVLKGSGDILKVDEFPYLAELKGRTLITTDGTTLLGADDKAGIAEILTVAEEIIKGRLPHGKICIGFTRMKRLQEEQSILMWKVLVLTMLTLWTVMRKARFSSRISMHRLHLSPFTVSAYIRDQQKT